MHDKEKTILVGLIKFGETEFTTKEYLDELEFLATTAGAVTLHRFTQKLKYPHPKYFIGAGKVDEIKEYITTYKVDAVIFDDELTPSQLKNLEKRLGEDVKILDRTNLILDIFAKRAQTSQAKTQVELAQNEYLLPRLTRMWTHLSRQKGGIGTKGPGEKEIETDRRIIRDKISLLKNKLKKIDRQSKTQRKKREQKVRVALVGYTNAGKSTIMNLMSSSDVLAENKLFATLDTTVRKVVVNNIPFLLSDTVGFIRKLPHSLVESFKSTLDEVREADILVHVIDISHPNFQQQIDIVNKTLTEIGVTRRPTLLVFNKIDLIKPISQVNGHPKDDHISQVYDLDTFQKNYPLKENETMVLISATRKTNLEKFKNQLLDIVIDSYKTIYPYYPISVLG